MHRATAALQGPCVPGASLASSTRGAGHAAAASAPTRQQRPRPCRRQARCAAAPASEGLSYKDAGVDIDAGNELVKRIQKLNPNIGGFSGMVPFGELQQQGPAPTS